MTKKHAKIAAFVVASAALLIVAWKGGAAGAIAAGALTIIGALSGVDIGLFSGGF